MKQNILETFVGFMVLAVAAFFLLYFYGSKQSDSREEYTLNATFQNVEGVIKGSDVMIGGIIVGYIQDLKLDPVTYDAKIVLSIDKDVKIPSDSRAAIASSGFLGGKYVSITPGGDDNFLQPGDKIKYTQSSINLESLIGKFMYSGSSSNSSKSESKTEIQEAK